MFELSEKDMNALLIGICKFDLRPVFQHPLQLLRSHLLGNMQVSFVLLQRLDFFF
ncbi:hypothetical protein RGUI_3201 [Rhodovulum sp. P5]|nr:hypothetical protein RGUI_3201 [Rhodovulum sp. P5]